MRIKEWILPIAAVLLLALLLPRNVVPAAAEAGTDATTPVININGVGEINIEPDMAQLSIGVVTEAKDAKTAQEKNALLAGELVKAIQKAGVEDKDIQTQNFSVNPKYDYSEKNPGAPMITGYTVNNSLKVKVRDLSSLGAVLDAAREAGANNINGIQLLSSKENDLQTEAMAAAAQDAKTKAEAIAKALGKEVVDVVSVTAGSFSAPVPVYRSFDTLMKADAAPTPVMSGEMTIRAEVQVQFKIQ